MATNLALDDKLIEAAVRARVAIPMTGIRPDGRSSRPTGRPDRAGPIGRAGATNGRHQRGRRARGFSASRASSCRPVPFDRCSPPLFIDPISRSTAS